MDGSLESILNLYVFTTGRRLFALRQVRALAEEQRFTELVKHCDAAFEHDLATRVMERRWAGEPATTGTNPAAQRIDVLVDRTLGAIRDHVVTPMQANHLADLALQYREALEAPPPSLIDWGRVRAARAEGQATEIEKMNVLDTMRPFVDEGEALTMVELYVDEDLGGQCVGVCLAFAEKMLFVCAGGVDGSLCVSEVVPVVLSDESIRRRSAPVEWASAMGRSILWAWAKINAQGRIDGLQI